MKSIMDDCRQVDAGRWEIYGNQPVKWYLVHFAKTLKINYWRYINRKKGTRK